MKSSFKCNNRLLKAPISSCQSKSCKIWWGKKCWSEKLSKFSHYHLHLPPSIFFISVQSQIKKQHVNTLLWAIFMEFFPKFVFQRSLSLSLSLTHTQSHNPPHTHTLSLSSLSKNERSAAFAWIHSVNMYMYLMGHPHTWKSIYYV